MLFYLSILAWAAIGASALIYSWRCEFDVKLSDAVFLTTCGSILGLFALLFIVPDCVLLRRITRK